MEITLAIVDHYTPRPREVRINRLPAILGRGQEADVPIDDPWMSHFHCMFSEAEGRLMVRDMGSRNGVFINGLRSNEAVLRNGDWLTLGLTKVSVRFDHPPARAAADGTVPPAAEDPTGPMADGSGPALAALSPTLAAAPSELPPGPPALPPRLCNAASS